jgi:hypothetical protein
MSGFLTRRAFVVKLSTDADCAHLTGRVEHIESGQTAHFEALEGLGEFIVQVIDPERDEAAKHDALDRRDSISVRPDELDGRD